jgi:hypothetical protein
VSSIAARLLAALATAALVAASVPACSQGGGDGSVRGTLNVPGCWTGNFDLAPDFFAANPYRQGLQLRIQNGSDFETFSDGLSILVSDISQVRPNTAAGQTGKYGQPLEVSLPPEVTPPGVPVKPDPNPALVGMILYLQKTCRTQNVTLDAVAEVTLPTDGTCDTRAMMGADPTAGCDPNKESPAGVGSGKSFITFTSLFDGQVDEPTASERRNRGCFDIYLADPREVAPGGLGPPPVCRGHIKGTFDFFFERGRPAQPFP